MNGSHLKTTNSDQKIGPSNTYLRNLNKRGAQPRVFGAGQRGFSLLAITVVITIAAFIGLFAFKVGPAYMEYMTVKSIGQDIVDNEALMKQPKSKVMSAIAQAYRANSLWELKPEESFTLQKSGTAGYIVTIDYEKRENLLSNIYVVTKFNKVVEKL